MRRRGVIFLLILFLVACSTEPLETENDLVFNCITEETITIEGISMRPILNDGQEVNLLKKFHLCNNLSRGDLVVFEYKDEWHIKRVAGIPGDSFKIEQMDDGYFLKINDEFAENSVGEKYFLTGPQKRVFSLYVNDYGDSIPDRTYIVLGENITRSEDSRSIGLIRDDDFIGRVKPD